MFTNRLRCELKAVFGLTALLPLPILAGMGLLEIITYRDFSHDPAVISDVLSTIVLRDFTLLLPLVAAVSVAHVMSVEKDEGFAELRSSYWEPIAVQICLRTAIAFLLGGIALGLGWVIYSFLCGFPLPFAWIAPALPPAIFLLGLTLLVNHASGSYWAAIGTALGYWLLELQTRGALTGQIFLFNPVWNSKGVNAQWNVALVLGAGICFLAANFWLGQWRSMGWKAWGPGRDG